MIRYYAYYNHGGYKDFYLGSQADDVEFKYFLPLLNVHEQSLIGEPNEELRTNVERQKQLPKLIALSDETLEYNYPGNARTLMSHSGYKLLYKCLETSQSVLAIRDISGPVDSYGRQTPFNVMFVGDNAEDIKVLDVVAEYTRCNLQAVEKLLKSLFENDFVENGLKFNMRSFKEYIDEIIATGNPLLIDKTLNKAIRLLIIPNGQTMANALREQNLSQRDLAICYHIDGTMVYKAVRSQQPTAAAQADYSRQDYIQELSTKHPMEHSNPSLHAMFNVPKREDIDKLWKYIYSLEKRIVQLENNK